MSETQRDAGEARDLYGLTPDLLAAILDALDRDDAPRLEALTVPLHAADIADLLEQIAPAQRRQVIDALGPELDPAILAELGEAALADLREHLGLREFSRLVGALAPNDAVDVLEDLESGLRHEVLAAVPAGDRQAVREGLDFPPDSAGRLMRRDVVALPMSWDVGQTIDHLRGARDLPDEFYAVFVVDPDGRPLGAIALSAILKSRRATRLKALVDGRPATVGADTDQEEVAWLFRQYGLSEMPVVDDASRMRGAIAFDDMVDVMSEESAEDALRLGGVARTDLHDSVAATARRRFLWLLINLATAVLASVVIGVFEGTIRELVALAVLMPIVASMGGNAGTQTMTVAVTALATKDLTRANAMRLVVKEIAVALANGALLAVLMGALAWAWFENPALGAVIAVAMVANLLVAGLFGAAIPLLLERLKIDPAVAAGVLLTTVTDVVGFFVFLALGAAVLL